jgi:DNA-binding transcriptional ArsR family regulator
MSALNGSRTPSGYGADIAPVAALMADSARATMLGALLGGHPLAAGELSQIAGVSPATASAHLGKLLDGGMVAVTKQGRHRYYSLAGHEIATVLEAISEISPVKPVRSLRQSREADALAQARTCYDHLAGRAGVALLDAFLGHRILTGSGTGKNAAYQVTPDGANTLEEFGVVPAPVRRRLPGLDPAPSAPERGARGRGHRPAARARLDRVRAVQARGEGDRAGPRRARRHVRLVAARLSSRPAGITGTAPEPGARGNGLGRARSGRLQACELWSSMVTRSPCRT